MPRFTCLACGALLKDRDSLASGECARCTECGHTFREEEVEPAKRPRKKRKKKSRRLLVLSLLVVSGGLLLLGAGIIGAVIVIRGGGNNILGFNTGINPKLTEANLKKLWAGMSVDQAQEILGAGRECDAKEINKVCDSSFDAYHQGMGLAVALAGQACDVEVWYRWQNGGMHVFVGFHKSKSGVPRLVLLRWFCQYPNGAFESVEAITHPDMHQPNAMPHREWLDHLAAEHDKRKNLLNVPKWQKGPAIRKSLVGRWRTPSFDPVVFPSLEGYDFNADGSCVRTGGPGDRHPGTYHFVDDAHIDITTEDEVMVLGGGKAPMTTRYRVLVNAKELILVSELPSGPNLDMTLERH